MKTLIVGAGIIGVIYGYFLNILGPITPSFLKEEFKLSYTVSSLHFTAFAVAPRIR